MKKFIQVLFSIFVFLGLFAISSVGNAGDCKKYKDFRDQYCGLDTENAYLDRCADAFYALNACENEKDDQCEQDLLKIFDETCFKDTDSSTEYCAPELRAWNNAVYICHKIRDAEKFNNEAVHELNASEEDGSQVIKNFSKQPPPKAYHKHDD